MGRFDSKFSDAQRAAIAHALNVEGLTATEATARASNGQLGKVPPFDVAESTAREIAARYRHQAPDATARQRAQHQEQLLVAGLELMQRELDRLTEASNERPLTTQEVTRLSKMLRTMSDLAGTPGGPTGSLPFLFPQPADWFLPPVATKETQSPWFLKPGKLRHPLFLHWSFAVGRGGWASVTTMSPC